MFLEKKYTKLFLDLIDEVLNSNTFLLQTEINFKSLEEAKKDVHKFLSEHFTHQLLEQDIARGWDNYYIANHKGDRMPMDNISFVKPSFDIQLQELDYENALYFLRTMITVETNDYNFWSPYSKQIETEKAIDIVKNFIYEITIDKDWKLFVLNTDFGYAKTDKYHSKSTLAYFEGDFGSDSASIIVREDNTAYLLLTNGID